MVLDNVDDVDIFFAPRHHEHLGSHCEQPPLLAAYLPQTPNGSILITSRSKIAAARLTGGYNNIKEVRLMDERQGLELLRRKLQDFSSEESAVELLSALDHVPFAISQVAAYINRRVHMTTARYLAEFYANSTSKQRLLDFETLELRRDKSA